MDYHEIVEMKATLDGIIEMAIPHAKAIWAYYNALKEEGFNDEQALKIVMRHGVIPPYGNAPETK